MNNNKVLLVINGVLVVAVAILFYLHFSSPRGSDEFSGTVDTTALSAKGKAVVYVNADSLMAKYEFSKKIQADIEAKKTAMDNTLRSKQTAFQNKYNEYKNKAEYLTPPERAKAEQDLSNMQVDGENAAMQLQGKLQQDATELNDQLLKKVEDFLKDYAKANGHMYVLQYVRGMGSIVYGDPSLDITKDVVVKLNERYKKELENPTEPVVEEEGKKDDKKDK